MPKPNTTKKCVNVTKPVNTTTPIDVTNSTESNDTDTDIVDKKNKIEYLENLERDLTEARAKI
mgnify:CR=1 FL=1